MNKRIVFLYTELADYIRVCLEELAATGVEVHVFAYPVNPEAPFDFDLRQSKCYFYARREFGGGRLLAQVEKIDPHAIVCSGWVDRPYVDVCRKYQGRIPTILALDNKTGRTIKSRLSRLRAVMMYRQAFSHAWVPGSPQRQYARSLKFRDEDIFEGFYTADIRKFGGLGANAGDEFPKRFVYLGRYLEFKGLIEMWDAFADSVREGWELRCAGQGSLFEKRKIHPSIYHFGFVQGADLDKFVAQGGVFVLPSRREPWGVVVHEFAAAGYPLLCSDEVGAASAFLVEGENGFSFKAGSKNALEDAMIKIMNTPSGKLLDMGKKSRELAQKYSVTDWVETALRIIELR